MNNVRKELKSYKNNKIKAFLLESILQVGITSKNRSIEWNIVIINNNYLYAGYCVFLSYFFNIFCFEITRLYL